MSDLRIEFYAVVELPTGEELTVPLDALTYEETIETDIFDEGLDQGDRTSADGSTDSGGSDDGGSAADDGGTTDDGDTTDDGSAADDGSGDDNTSDGGSGGDDDGLIPLAVD